MISQFWLFSILQLCVACITLQIISAATAAVAGVVDIRDAASELQSQMSLSPIHLTNATTLSSLIHSAPLVLVHFCDFHHPKCEFAIQQFTEAANKFSSNSNNNINNNNNTDNTTDNPTTYPITFAYFDCTPDTQSEHACRALDSFVYPAYLIFNNGKKEKYYGKNYTIDGIHEEIQRITTKNYNGKLNPIEILNSTNYYNTVLSPNKPLSLILFTALWCIECKKILPIIEEAGNLLNSNEFIESYIQYWNHNGNYPINNQINTNINPNKNIFLYSIDGLSNIPLTQSESITTYPQFILYRYGKKYEYHGPKKYNSTELANYLLELIYRPASTLIQSISQFNEFIEYESAMILYMNMNIHNDMDIINYDSTQRELLLNQTELYEQYQYFTQNHRHLYRFGHIHSPSLIKLNSIKIIPSIVIYHSKPYRIDNEKSNNNKNNNNKEYYNSLDSTIRNQLLPIHFLSNQNNYTEITKELFSSSNGIKILNEFLHRYQYPWIPFIPLSKRELYDRPLCIIWMEFEFESINTSPIHSSSANSKKFQFHHHNGLVTADSLRRPLFTPEIHYWRNKFIQIQSKFPNIRIGIASGLQFQQELMKFRLSMNGEEFIAGIYGSENEKYSMKNSIYSSTIQGLEGFLYDFIALKLSPIHQSQRIIPYSGNGPIRIVADNFNNEIILNHSYDQLLYLYSGYCEYCLETVEPLIHLLWKQLKNEKNIRILQMNADLNDISIYKPFHSLINEFPTILFIKSNEKSRPWLYRGSYDMESLLNWIKPATSLPMNFLSPEEIRKEKRMKMNQNNNNVNNNNNNNNNDNPNIGNNENEIENNENIKIEL